MQTRNRPPDHLPGTQLAREERKTKDSAGRVEPGVDHGCLERHEEGQPGEDEGDTHATISLVLKDVDLMIAAVMEKLFRSAADHGLAESDFFSVVEP